jgi:hypothetical protein
MITKEQMETAKKEMRDEAIKQFNAILGFSKNVSYQRVETFVDAVITAAAGQYQIWAWKGDR